MLYSIFTSALLGAAGASLHHAAKRAEDISVPGPRARFLPTETGVTCQLRPDHLCLSLFCTPGAARESMGTQSDLNSQPCACNTAVASLGLSPDAVPFLSLPDEPAVCKLFSIELSDAEAFAVGLPFRNSLIETAL